MTRIAVVVSNPCTSDARVIKMIETARDAGYNVQVFATTSGTSIPWEVVGGVTYHRLEWRPAQRLAERGVLGLFNRMARRATTLFAQLLVPYRKYALFTEVFSDAIAACKPDLIHAHDLICLPAAARAAEQSGARLVYDAHELEVHRNPPLPLHKKWFVGGVERKYARRADAVITVGRKVGDVLAHEIGRKDITILYNAPYLQECTSSLRRDLRVSEEQRVLLYVGKVTVGRGVGDILNLLPQLPDVIFATVGPSDANTKRQLLKQAERMNLRDRFRILPPVPHAQVTSYIGGADLGIISVEPVTLSYRYCMPNKLFELSFADVPIISNRLDEIEEFLGELGNGEVVDFDDRPQLSYVLFRMLQENRQYRLSDAARETLHRKYSWATQAQTLRELYSQVLAKSVAHTAPSSVASSGTI